MNARSLSESNEANCLYLDLLAVLCSLDVLNIKLFFLQMLS
jgi:hypothetical protein